VLVLCAAGNQVGFVVFPAAYEEVIAVAASTVDDEIWSGSCRGPAVDITAPGASVWRAEVDTSTGTVQHVVKRGDGTSFAVAGTAGVAALWLSFHKRSALIEKYGKDRLASIFKQLLQSTCRTPNGWDTGSFGAGIVHDGLERIVHLLAPASRSGVSRALAEFLRTDETHLPAVLREVGDELAFNIGADPALRQRLIEASSKPAVTPRAARGPRAKAARADLGAARRRLSGRGSAKLKKALR
jgi:thermitase